MSTATNFDEAELAKFGALAHRWWDPNSEFKPLHDINPLRLDYIERLAGGFDGRRVIDVGCGGGILSEAMARRGARVTGIDLSDKALKVAQLHALEVGIEIDYRLQDVDVLADVEPAGTDIVTCMELLEHVPDPAQTVAACARLLRPGGVAVFSTINRNPKSYMLAVIGAEYVLHMLPRGTHDYARFIRPSELCRFARNAGLEATDMIGMTYNPITRQYKLEADTDVNYILACRNPENS